MNLHVKLTSVMMAQPGAAERTVCSYLGTYADETGKGAIKRVDSFFAPRDYQRADIPDAQRMIVTSEPVRRGVLRLGGFLAREALTEGIPIVSPAEKEPRDDWIQQVGRLYCQNLAARVPYRREGNDMVLGYRMMVSMAPEVTGRLAAAKIDAPQVLRATACRTWTRYPSEQGWPEDALGWIEGEHLDKSHLHLHQLVLPRTDNGIRLKMSNRMKTASSEREDVLSRLSEIGTQELEREIDERVPSRTVAIRLELFRTCTARFVAGRLPRGGAQELMGVIDRDVILPWATSNDRDPARCRNELLEWARGRSAGKGEREPDVQKRWLSRLWLGWDWSGFLTKPMRPDDLAALRPMLRSVGAGEWPEADLLTLGKKAGGLLNSSDSLLPFSPVVDGAWRGQVEQWAAFGEEVLMRALQLDALATRAKKDSVVRAWFGPDLFDHSVEIDHSVAAAPIAAHRPSALPTGKTALELALLQCRRHSTEGTIIDPLAVDLLRNRPRRERVEARLEAEGVNPDGGLVFDGRGVAITAGDALIRIRYGRPPPPPALAVVTKPGWSHEDGPFWVGVFPRTKLRKVLPAEMRALLVDLERAGIDGTHLTAGDLVDSAGRLVIADASRLRPIENPVLAPSF